MKMLDNRVLMVLQKALDGSAARQRAIAHNIANVNTPGYKKLDVSFENQLREALVNHNQISLSTTHSKHVPLHSTLSQVKPHLSRNDSTSMRPDKNNVDMDQEMTKMAANSIYYNSAVEQLNKRIALLKHIISEGRR